MAHNGETPVMEVRGLKKHYKATRAVDGVDFQLRPGETFGVVGESGCGKSTIAKLMMGLETPTAGEVYFRGERVDQMPEGKKREMRPRFQMVFQDSGSSLNGRKRIADILREPMLYHRVVSRADVDKRIDTLLDRVGLPASARERYPHEFSGGQRQRICIAKALSLEQELIILDEPVSALDVSVQAQILNLLRDLQEQLELTYLFIGHGLGAVHYISHRIAVMYMGRMVEYGDSDEVFQHPVHPYTRALLDAAPSADYSARGRKRLILRGEVGRDGWTKGCAFCRRCPYASAACAGVTSRMTCVSQEHFSCCVPQLPMPQKKEETACAGM